jgi:hypothetical protein
MPMVGTGLTHEDARRPLYKDSIFTPNAVPWAMFDFGVRQVCLLAATTTDPIHVSLIANADVYAFPDGFEAGVLTVGTNATALTNTLENTFSIPAQWVSSQLTYAAVAHTVGAMFQFLQRLNGMIGNIDPFAGATLNTQLRNLAPGIGQAIIDAGASFGWDMSGISNQTTLRVGIKYMADQWGATPLLLGPFQF